MKKLFTFLVPMAIGIILTGSVFAQSPEKMSYQAVIRNSSNALVTNTQVGMQISILQSSASGTAVYVETQTSTSNANGLVSIEIGSTYASVVSGDFSTINWANGPYFIKTETDPAGGTDYTITGTSQLLSVPYALHAKTAETVSGTITEADPVYTGSEAANITANDITNLGNLSGTNTGDQNLSGLSTTTDLSTGLDLKVDKVLGKGLSTNNFSNAEKNKLAAISGTNTGDQDLSGLATKTALGDSTAQIRSEIPDVSGFLSTETDPAFTGSEAANITASDITNLGYLSGINTGDQELSGLATKTALGDSTAQVRSEIPDLSGFLSTETDPEFTNSQAANITAGDITNLSNLSGTNTGDQDISGIAVNATAIENEVSRAIAAELTIAAELYADSVYLKGLIDANSSYISVLGTKAGADSLLLRGLINTNTTDISTEVSNATAAIIAFAAKFYADSTYLKSLIDENTTDISVLETKAGADSLQLRGLINTNTTGITTEVIRATAAELAIASDLNEASAHLQGLIDANTSDISGNATAIATKVTANSAITAGTNTKIIYDSKGLVTGSVAATTTDIAEGTNLYYTDARVSANTTVVANTAKTGITSAQADAIVANTAKVGVTPGTATGQMQYWNGTAWVTVAATENEGATLQMIGGVPTWTGGTPPPPAVGDSYQGGVVFYILQSGDPGYVDGETHGFIAATSDQGWITWWNGSYVVTGATATALGTGSANTTLIISAQGNTGTYAAKVCADYSVTVDGVAYDDWYLPSHDELYKFYVASSVVPGFSYSYYWSSTEADSNNAWWLNIYPTYMIAIDKKGSYPVRAIRSF